MDDFIQFDQGPFSAQSVPSGVVEVRIGIPTDDHRVEWHTWTRANGYEGCSVEVRPDVDPDLLRTAEIRALMNPS